MKFTMTEFIEILSLFNEDHIGCDGQNTYSHKGKSHVWFTVNGDDACYEIDEIQVDLLPGCNCGYGIDIVLKKEDVKL